MGIKQIKVGSLETNCYLLINKKEILIIDPGDEPEKIIQHMGNSNKKVSILNTHYHYDHTLANNQLRNKFNAKILIHKDEKDFIDFKADKFLKDDDIVKIGNVKLKVLHTPGHTQGSICLLGDTSVFTGDTLFKDGFGRTDLRGGDDKKMFESLKKLTSILKQGITVYPGHGEPFQWENNS